MRKSIRTVLCILLICMTAVFAVSCDSGSTATEKTGTSSTDIKDTTAAQTEDKNVYNIQSMVFNGIDKITE